MTSHSRNANVGMGNQIQRARKMVTVGLYTARKPVEASSRMCRAKARHSANHALPKPDAERADGACFMRSPVKQIFNHPRTIGNRKSVLERPPIARQRRSA